MVSDAAGLMPTVVSTDDLGRSYPELLDTLRRHGDLLQGRGGAVRELVDYGLYLSNPRRCVVARPGFSSDFMRLEIAMLLAGVYDPRLTVAVTPKAAELTTPLTAYGPRIRAQMGAVIDELRDRPSSRRALVYVGQADDLREATIGGERGGEMPCTCVWQFLLRAGHLHMIVYMRSWDAVWGLSYDVPCFVAVQMAVAAAVRAPIGNYAHHAGSFHLYERHWDMRAQQSDQELELPWIGAEWHETREAAGAELQRMREEHLA